MPGSSPSPSSRRRPSRGWTASTTASRSCSSARTGADGWTVGHRGGAIGDLLASGTPGRFEAYPVSVAVSSSRANGPGLVEPIPIEELDGVVDPMTGEIVGARR